MLFTGCIPACTLWLCLGSAAADSQAAVADAVTWVMLNVNANGREGDAHVLVFPGGHTVLVDTGWNGQDLARSLRARGLSRLDQVVISHPHKDHYAAPH